MFLSWFFSFQMMPTFRKANSRLAFSIYAIHAFANRWSVDSQRTVAISDASPHTAALAVAFFMLQGESHEHETREVTVTQIV
jgi:hypothetical protein